MAPNRSFALAIAVAAFVSGSVYADDITVDTTPFVSSRSRAEVRQELMTPNANEWALQFNQREQLRSAYASRQARAEYVANRSSVRAMTGEDSGSASMANDPPDTRALGGPPR